MLCEAKQSYLVECYWPGVSAEALAVVTAGVLEAARDLQGQGRELRFLGSLLVAADETVFCLFEGAEIDVRAASERAGLQYERVLRSLRIWGNDRLEEHSSRGG